MKAVYTDASVDSICTVEGTCSQERDLVWTREQESYAGGSIGAGSSTYVGHILREVLDKER